jgi:hypothetical protein
MRELITLKIIDLFAAARVDITATGVHARSAGVFIVLILMLVIARSRR